MRLKKGKNISPADIASNFANGFRIAWGMHLAATELAGLEKKLLR
jgi:hypothetical protein